MPWQFERLQPHEFYTLIDGYTWRKERQEEMFAYFVSGLMNVEGKSLKQRMTPKALLKPLRQPQRIHNKSEDEQYLREKFNL